MGSAGERPKMVKGASARRGEAPYRNTRQTDEEQEQTSGGKARADAVELTALATFLNGR